ncbi:hypothetical protein LR48_Vigan01g123100 [Vigna angularis]|uniref:Retrotransposon gag domain-containing protein n=1 Tax=Phaseolus angularis TaxID=3914 RepID=A0A0L9TMJ2_PHAAN|nr:hypothetical protein LR48_Vigan01g123100 [Vigna angularis]
MAEWGNNHQNENDGSRNRQPSQHTNPKGRGRREPSPLQTVRPSSLLPFTATIMQTPMLEKNPPILEKYDGSTNLDNSSQDLHQCNGVLHEQRSGHMQSFFLITQGRGVECTKQEKDETLKAFMKRYNETARRVKDVNHTFIINNLPSCLRLGYFAERLYTRPPKPMDELQERIAKFIRIEDMRNSRKKQQEVSTSGSKKEGKQSFNNNDKNEVLEEALNTELLTIRKKSSPKDADERKSCRFHLNRGHIIEECDVLKDEIERLIRGDHLHKFVEEEGTRIRSPPRGKSQCRETE